MPIEDDAGVVSPDTPLTMFGDLKPVAGTADARVAFYNMGYEAARSELSTPSQVTRRRFAEQIATWFPRRFATAACVLAIASLSSFTAGRWTQQRVPADARQLASDDSLLSSDRSIVSEKAELDRVGTSPRLGATLLEKERQANGTLPSEISKRPNRSGLPISILDAPGFELTAGGPRSQPDRTLNTRPMLDAPPMLRAAEVLNPSQSLLN